MTTAMNYYKLIVSKYNNSQHNEKKIAFIESAIDNLFPFGFFTNTQHWQ